MFLLKARSKLIITDINQTIAGLKNGEMICHTFFSPPLFILKNIFDMRFAILSPIYPYRGGIAQFSGMLYNELQKEGYEVKAFNFKRLYPNSLFPGKTQYVGKNDHAIKIESSRLLDSINPISYQQTTNAIRDYAPDVLIIAYWMSFFVPAYAHIANRMKNHCKIITLIHNAIPHEPHFFDKPLATLLFKQCHGFIVMSDNVKKDLLMLSPHAQFIQNPHPLYDHFGQKVNHTLACEQLRIDSTKKNLLFFGLIRDYKGLDLLIEALDLLDNNFQLIIAGECYGDFNKYEKLIDNSSARSRIIVHNRYISDEEIPLFFSAADALILPYRSATQSGVVSVAYHYDLPMLSTPVGDFYNSIARPETGIVVPEISATAIAKGIKDLFTPEQQAQYPQRIAKEKELLSWSRLTKKNT